VSIRLFLVVQQPSIRFSQWEIVLQQLRKCHKCVCVCVLSIVSLIALYRLLKLHSSPIPPTFNFLSMPARETEVFNVRSQFNKSLGVCTY